MQVAKWGNSLAVRLPAALVRDLNLKEGDSIEIRPAAGGMVAAKVAGPDEILADLRRFRGRLPRSERMDRDAANAR